MGKKLVLSVLCLLVLDVFYVDAEEVCSKELSESQDKIDSCMVRTSTITLDSTFLWQSRYVSMGRDQLNDGGIYSIDGGVGWNNFSAGAWFATGDREGYEEVDFSVAYTMDMGSFCTEVGYNRLEFLSSNESDNEFFAQIDYSKIPYVTLCLYSVYATESGGSAIEPSVVSEWFVFKDRLRIEPYALVGFDFGYSTEEFDGENNFQVGVDLFWRVTTYFDVVGSVAHSWALEDMKREGLGDLSWGTIGLSFSY